MVVDMVSVSTEEGADRDVVAGGEVLRGRMTATSLGACVRRCPGRRGRTTIVLIEPGRLLDRWRRLGLKPSEPVPDIASVFNGHVAKKRDCIVNAV